MAADPWAIDASAGAPAYSAGEMRLLTTVPFLAGAGASLGVRSGVRLSGSGTDLLVQAQASPNMTVKANTGVIAAQGAISATQGAYTWALDALLASLTIAAAHATLARTDLVVVRIRDANVDTSGQRDGGVIVITGTAGGGIPTPPTDATYFTLAQVAVGAAVTTIVAGNITDKRQYTAANGAPVPCLSTDRPAGFTGLRIWEIDTGYELRWNGSKYLRDPVRAHVAAQALYTSNATLAAVPGMTIPLEANSKYELTALLTVFGLQNVGVNLALSLPASPTVDVVVNGWNDADGALADRIAFLSGGLWQMGSYGFSSAAAANRTQVRVKGVIITTTAGNLTLFGAQRVSSASSSSVEPTSAMTLAQLA